MKRLWWLIAFSSLLLAPAVRGQYFDCGHEDGEEGRSYDYEAIDEVHAKLVFVAFPDDMSELLGPDHQAVVDQVSSYLRAHSQGRLTISEDTGILLHEDEDMQDLMAGTATAWMAQKPPSFYRDVSRPEDAGYLEDWEALGVANWWGLQGEATHLYAEILYQIWQDYQTVGSPFGAPQDEYDYELFFVFLSNESPFPWPADGMPDVSVVADEVNDDTDDFFANVGDSRRNPGGFAGVGQIHCTIWSLPGGPDSNYHPPHLEFRPHESAYSLLHEFVHTLGPNDGPPKLEDTPEEKRYFYGNLNLLCQHLPQGQGIPPIGLGWLARLPWVQVVDFTGLNLKEQVVYDIHAGDVVNIPEDPAQGKIYMFRRTDGGRTECFYIAYHAGVGVDAQPRYDDPPTTLVPTQGVEIWHCEPSGTMFDIESAFGLYSDVASEIMPADASVKTPEYFATVWSGGADPENGYDNYDFWQIVNSSAYRSAPEYRRYQGDVFDFFRMDLIAPYAAWNKKEFSYRSNPNSFWYSLDPYSPAVMLRRNPQNVENSLIVRLKEQHDDAPSPYAVVDFLSAPYEDIVTPGFTEHETYPVGQPLTIQWGDDFADAINRVEIFYSPFGGYPNSYVKVDDLELDPGQTSCTWTPLARHASLEGRVKIIYHNSLTAYTCDAESEHSFQIGTAAFAGEVLASPQSEEELVTQAPYEIQWTDYQEVQHGVHYLVTVEYVESGTAFDAVATNLVLDQDETYDPQTEYRHDAAAGLFTWTWTPTAGQASSDAALKLQFRITPEGDAIESNAAENIELYPVAGRYAAIPPATHHIDFSEAPAVAVPLILDPAATGDDWPDLIFGMRPGVGAMARVYENTSSQGPPPSFQGVDVLEGQLQGAAAVAAAGDYNNDGAEDLVVAAPSGLQLLRWDGSRFQNTPWSFERVDLVRALTWVDIDRDSDLDLYVGRATVSTVGGSTNYNPAEDMLLENQGAAGGWTFVDVSERLPFGADDTTTFACLWLNLDDDLYWEIFVGDASAGGPGWLLLQEGPEGQFTLDTQSGPPQLPRHEVIGAKAIDYNRDGRLDIAVSYRNGALWVGDFANDTAVRVSEGGNILADNLTPIDYDGNGLTDLVVTAPTGAQDDRFSLRLFANFTGTSYSSSFKEIGQGLNLWPFVDSFETAGIWGIVSDDFDRDGDLDIIAGFSQAGRRVSSKQRADGTEVPPAEDQWIALRLVGGWDDNKNAIGARVTLLGTGDAVLGTQVVDGASGQAGQSSRWLYFGLGQQSTPVKAHVVWPSGRTDTYPSGIEPALDLRARHVLTQRDEVIIRDPAPTCSFSLAPPDTLIMHFNWRTNCPTLPSLDRVVLTPVSGPCTFGNLELYGGLTGVSVEVAPAYDPVKREPYFQHTLTWNGWPCQLGCRFRFEVQSGNGRQTGSRASAYEKTVKVCTQG